MEQGFGLSREGLGFSVFLHATTYTRDVVLKDGGRVFLVLLASALDVSQRSSESRRRPSLGVSGARAQVKSRISVTVEPKSSMKKKPRAVHMDMVRLIY